MPRESRFLLEAWERRSEFGDLSDEVNRRRLARWIFTNKATRPGRMDVKPSEAIRRLVAAPPTFGSLLGTCFLLYAEQHGKLRWGDKRPHYVQQLPAIFAMFPDAQFINVVRDPRGSVASIRKLGWFDGDVALATELWVRARRAADSGRARLRPDQFLEIRYEDLVEQPETTLERVTGFLGLAADGVPEMLAYHQDADVPRNRYHWRISRPVTTVSVRGWEETLKQEEVAFVESVTGRLMRRYGYTPVAGSAAPPPEMRRRFIRRRAGTTVVRGRRAAAEARRCMTYRHPVAAIPRYFP